ncbi:Peptidoglycan-N-acetylmuramic acid deacetylase PdaC [Acinetobacter pittii]|uniref:Peptidoglycan-N-acetylmuramic acid deacetylase PdaC n=2 Tax=Acinetobacter pittii TaxID=48296 RepID=A0AB33B863_ACIPI|nr:Peptidoglycan-N-acetylmuramic acid deacetylase PdaC [Acinetobacter pittii]
MMLSSKASLRLTLLASAIFLAACQPKADPKDSQEQQKSTVQEQKPVELTLKGETIPSNVVLPDCDGKTCPEFTVERLQSNFPFIDKIIDQQILSTLNQILEIAEPDAKSKQTEQKSEASAVAGAEQKNSFDAQVQRYANSFIDLDNELKALSSNHQINLLVKPKILQAQGKVVTVVLNSSSYLGGAHGSAAQHYYNFDLKEQKQIKLEDLLRPQQKAALEKLAHEAFKTWVMDSKLADNIADYEQAWPFKLSNNFLLGEQGLILQYGEYEIGPYVVGLPRLVIPYDQLQDVLKEEYLPQPRAKPASAPVAKSAG